MFPGLLSHSRSHRNPFLERAIQYPTTPTTMRIITGDECGLLKETIPEASRNLNPTERGAVQASANCEGVTRLDGPHQQPQHQTRRKGIVGLVKLPDSIVDDEGDDGDNSSPFAFAALRVDGTVETWASRRPVVKRGKPTELATYHMLSATSNVFANDKSEDISDEGKQVAGKPVLHLQQQWNRKLNHSLR